MILKIIDFFAGVGGLSLGFVKLGAELIFANDFDKSASQTFRLNHPGVPFFEGGIEDLDVSKVASAGIDLSGIDVIMGGVPCQAFSMAGRRIRTSQKDQIDDRVYLFRHFLRFVADVKPKVVLIENVRGITSMLEGRVMSEIKNSLENLGYLVDWKYLNAADYGAPQVRIRTIILANRIGVENEFPTPQFDKESWLPVSSVLSGLPELNHDPRFLTGKALERVSRIKPGENWTSLPPELQTKSVHSGAYGRLDPNLPARTLTTRFDTPSVGYVTHPTENRTLTVREGARIQGFPDNFEFCGSKMEQYKQVGNAVSPFMSAALAASVYEMLTRGKIE
jgi:DNA (cytosine-5)-methyltransferase 1